MAGPQSVIAFEKIIKDSFKVRYYSNSVNGFVDFQTRVCHLQIPNSVDSEKNISTMIFTIRNQKDTHGNNRWKIHSEGDQRTDLGATVPQRNAAINLAKSNNWKYIGVALAGDDVSKEELITKYAVFITPHTFGDGTVCDLTKILEEIQANNEPDVYNTSTIHDGKRYRLTFVKNEKVCDYILFSDYRIDPNFEVPEVRREPSELKIGKNVILYGVPGSGKSHKIKKDYCKNERYMERIVFHPDYTYSDFVGQILPRNEQGVISYQFVPGPFTRALMNAELDKENQYYLIIEEINRGNAPAIFGEIFQLLDRGEDGASVYGINNPDISNAVYGDNNQPVKIPSNLTILATMNTADQNVFTLDTAFKRRWQMEHIENNIWGCEYATHVIKGTNVSWGSFAETINEKISSQNVNGVFNEDKRLGAYFVNINELDSDSLFAEKVLMYLWNDAFKYDKEGIFKNKYRSLDSVLNEYKAIHLDVFDFSFPELDSTESTVDDFLSKVDSGSALLYKKLEDDVRAVGIEFSTAATKTYIAFRTPNNHNFAEIHVLSNTKLNIFTKTPANLDNLVGEEKTESSGWALRYSTYLESEDTDKIVDVIIDSYDQVAGD